MKRNNFFKKYYLINRITLKPNFGQRKKITILNKDVE